MSAYDARHPADWCSCLGRGGRRVVRRLGRTRARRDLYRDLRARLAD
jgi:hypothetical protein